MNTTTPLFLAIVTEPLSPSNYPESVDQLIAGVVISLVVLAICAFIGWLLVPKTIKEKTAGDSSARIRAIKSEFLQLSFQLEQNLAVEQRMVELEKEYRRLQPGGPFRTLSLKDELGKNKAVQLMKELEENGPLS
ncbi:MAG: hypothetical protein WC551_07400 [Patescibacteria group bacterium]